MVTYVTNDPSRWGAGKGAPATASEVDRNFWELETRIIAVEQSGPEPNNISSIEVTGSQMVVRMQDGSTHGPFTLPRAMIHYQGNWGPGVGYSELDLFIVPEDAVYLVLRPHVSDVEFDREATNAEGAALYRRLFPVGSGSGGGEPGGGGGGPLEVVTYDLSATQFYEFKLSDAEKHLRITGSTNNEQFPRTVSIPEDAAVAFPIGTVIYIENAGQGSLGISVATEDILLNGLDWNKLWRLRTEGSSAKLTKVGVNTWTLVGDILDSAGVSSFLLLTDTPVEFGAPGQTVAVSPNGDSLIFSDPPVGLFVSSEALAERLHWRIFITEMGIDTDQGVSIVELEFLDKPLEHGGTNQVGGGTATASSTLGANAPARAFNGSTDWQQNWHSSTTGPPHWLAYQFTAPVKITSVRVYPKNTWTKPVRFMVQYSDDGVTWTDGWEVAQKDWEIDEGDGTVTGQEFKAPISMREGQHSHSWEDIVNRPAVIDALPETVGPGGQVLKAQSDGSIIWAADETGGGTGGGIEDAPSDGQLYGRVNATWQVIPAGGGGGIEDAPADGDPYVRMDNAWVVLPGVVWSEIADKPALITALPGAVGNPGQIMKVDAGGNIIWAADETGGAGGGIEDAPSDGTPYARQDEGWVPLPIRDLEVPSAKAADYTLLLVDAHSYIRMNVGGPNTVTVPDEASVDFPVGTVITIEQEGPGQTTIVADANVTIRTPDTLTLRKQYSTVSLVKKGPNMWTIAGDLEEAA